MINYGAAFAIGYLMMFVALSIEGEQPTPWNPRLFILGGVVMGLNWVATLG